MTRLLCLGFGLCLSLVAAMVQASPADDDMPARTLACMACHGKEGRATPSGYFPRIAGKPAGYLYHQLLNFRDGRRSYPQMSYLLEHLTDEYLHEIAAYFAGLDLPYASPVPGPATPALLERGQQLVRKGDVSQKIPACVECHGSAMTGVLQDAGKRPSAKRLEQVTRRSPGGGSVCSGSPPASRRKAWLRW